MNFSVIGKSLEALIGVLTLIFVIYIGVNFSKKYFEYRPSEYAKYNSYLASFSDIDGLTIDSEVKLAGVSVGKLISYEIQKNYQILVKFSVLEKYNIPEDSSMTVATSGLMGGKYLRILAGTSNEFLKENDEVMFTQSSLNLESLIALLKK